MSAEMTIRVHSIEDDGLPPEDGMTGRIAFIWDGCVVSGWPIGGDGSEIGPYQGYWEPSEDRFGGPVTGVTHWVELPAEAWKLHLAEGEAGVSS